MERRPFRVVIIDHYDSYTNNLLQLLPTTCESDAERVPAWDPVIIRYDEYKWLDFQKDVLPQFDAIILSPGPGRPDHEADFGFNSQLIRDADIPILGICLGHQGIGTSLGASVVHAPHIKHGQVSQIQHDGSGLFDGLPQNFGGVQYNSLVLDPETLPEQLAATAWTQDVIDPNIKILMGVAHKSKPIFGVQWHPESICSSHGSRIVDNFKDVVQQFWSSNLERKHKFNQRSQTPNTLTSPVLSVGSHSNAGNAPRFSTNGGQKMYIVKAVDLGEGPTPEAVFDNLIRSSKNDGEAWLDSAKSRDEHSRYSYLSKGSFSVAYSTVEKSVTVYEKNQPIFFETPIDSFWDWFNVKQATIQSVVQALADEDTDEPTQAGRATLQVGFIGHFGYEMKRESLPGYQWTQLQAQEGCETADAQFMFAQEVLRFDHVNRKWKLFSLVRNGDADPIADMFRPTRIGRTAEEHNQFTDKLRAAFAALQQPSTAPIAMPKFSSQYSQKGYASLIGQARAAIKEGDSYEMTLTTKFRAHSVHDDYFGLYRTLRAKNPAPYSAYLNFPATETTILSSSPERFISIDQCGFAEMKPIKGTVGVSKDLAEDAMIKQNLATDVKELAENLMIVDLIRNDLHRISPPNTIKVPKLMQVESYETVHQLVTTIQSHINPSIGSVQAIKNIFPPGSMTGAPKLRSVQILDNLEQGHERGIYSGCLGYLCVSGAVDQSVVIRTIVRKGENLELGAGGAITWLSDADKEWDEVLVKATAVAEIDTSQSRADSLDPTTEHQRKT